MLHLDDNTAKFCILSIRLAPDGFSFFVYQEKSRALLLFKQGESKPYQDTIAQAIREFSGYHLENLPFKNVHILLDYPEVTSVPSALYDENKKENAFNFQYDISPREFVVNNHCSAYGLETLFPIPRNVYEYFGAHFTHYHFVHRLTLLLHQANKGKNQGKEQLYIAYTKDHFTVVGIRNHGLIYHNIFNLNCDEDLIYFLLLVFQELKFDQYLAQVYIDGPLAQKHPSIGVIKEYIQHVFFMTSPLTDVLLSEENHVKHYHTALFELSQCE